MPFQNPGWLSSDTYWHLTAYLFAPKWYWSGNGILDSSSAERVRIPFAQPEALQPAATLEPTLSPQAVGTLDERPVGSPARPNSETETLGTMTVRIISASILLVIGLGFSSWCGEKNRDHRSERAAMKTSIQRALVGCVILSLLLSACGAGGSSPAPTALPQVTTPPVPASLAWRQALQPIYHAR